MAIDIKMYGRVYKHVTDAIKQNYGRHTLPWKYDDTKNALRKSKEKECEDCAYPEYLHEALSDIVLRWCAAGYEGTGEADIYNIFVELWKFTKRWLLVAENHTADEIMTQMDQDATEEISKLCNNYPDCDLTDAIKTRTQRITDLYVAVMESVVMVAKEDGDAG